MESYKEKYEQALEVAKETYDKQPMYREWLEKMFPELAESEDEKIRKWIIDDIRYNIDNEPLNNSEYKKQGERAIAWLEKQESEPNWCHHKVDLSNCSEEYRKAYYDGWNNCNMQHSQCKSEKSDVLKCLINGMKFYYEDNEETTWGTEKFSMKVKDILSWLEKQGEYINFCNKIQVGDKVTRNRDGVLVNLSQLKRVAKPREKQCEQKFEMKTAEESLGIDSDTYNKIVDECIFGDDKVKPKFHEGEWITDGYDVLQISNVDIENQYYNCVNGNDGDINLTDKAYHLWTIQDAKDGDVLYINNTMSESIMIYKSFNNGIINKHASYNKFGFEGENYLTLNDGYIIPATKEQRDLLFQKMHEDGYEWDAENKQLNKIYIVHDTYCQENCKGFQETGKCFTDGECKAKKEAEQKLVESEGERIRKELIEFVKSRGGFKQEYITWIEKQGKQKPSDEEMKTLLRTEYEKGRADAIAEMQGEWSEEDIIHLNNCISYMSRLNSSEMDWLKSLKGRVQPKQEWSEEDLYMQKQAIKCVNNSGKLEVSTEEIEDWLKSIKNKIRPKQEWSEEDELQMQAIIDLLPGLTIRHNWLKSLKDRIQPHPKQDWSKEDSYYRNCIIQIIEEINNAPLKRREDWGAYINWLKSLGPKKIGNKLG